MPSISRQISPFLYSEPWINTVKIDTSILIVHISNLVCPKANSCINPSPPPHTHTKKKHSYKHPLINKMPSCHTIMPQSGDLPPKSSSPPGFTSSPVCLHNIVRIYHASLHCHLLSQSQYYCLPGLLQKIS